MRMHIDGKCSVGLPVTQHTIDIHIRKKRQTKSTTVQTSSCWRGIDRTAHPTNKCRGQLNWTKCKQIKTRPSHLTEQRTRHLRAPLPTCHNAYVCRRWATFSGFTRDNIQHASRIETELLKMHLRNRNGVMHTRWLYKKMQAHVHLPMSTRHCRPSNNARRTMNAFTCDTDLQLTTLCSAGNGSTILYTETSLVDGKWHNEKTFILVLLTQNLAKAAQNLPIHDAKKMSSNTEKDKLQTLHL